MNECKHGSACDRAARLGTGREPMAFIIVAIIGVWVGMMVGMVLGAYM